MTNWDIYYKKTLDNIHNNIKIFEKMLIFYYKLLIVNKLTDNNYISKKYNKYIQDIKYINIFKKLYLEDQNLGIFTIFNNIPDILHPLEKNIYMDYGSYISFLDPKYFKKKNKDIIILKNNILKYKKYYYPLIYQDIAPYNNNKKYIYVNIIYFDFEKYNNNKYCLLFITKNHSIYCYVNDIYKKKEKNKWIINNYKLEIEDIIYLTVLRKIKKEDITNVFNEYYIVKKNTEIYSYHSNKKEKVYWYSLKNDEYLNDPYKIFYKKNDILYKHIGKLSYDIKCINLSIDILSNNNIKKSNNINNFLDNIYILSNNNIKNINKKYTNKIYNGNLNKILSKTDNNKIWSDNKGKRLLNEIMNKSSNFYNENIYYFNFIEQYGFNNIINSYGYYETLDKFYSYELGVNNKSINNIKIIDIQQIII